MSQIFPSYEHTQINKTEFKFLHYVADGRCKFPKKDSADIVQPKSVFHGHVQGTSISKAGYYFGEADEKALDVYVTVKTIH